MSFDKRAFARRLEGPETFSRTQAEALTEACDTAIRDTLATKQDLQGLEAGLRGDMASLRGEMADLRAELRGDATRLRAEFVELRAEARSDFADLRAATAEIRLRVIAVPASVVVSGVGVIATLFRH